MENLKKLNTKKGNNGIDYSEYSYSLDGEIRTITLSEEEFDTIDKVKDYILSWHSLAEHTKKGNEIYEEARIAQEEFDFQAKFGHDRNA